MIVSSIREMLVRSGKFERFKDSYAHQVYVRIFHSRLANKRSKEYLFYKKIINMNDVRMVFDIGANYGNKTKMFLQNAERVVCVEPNPELIGSLRRRYSDNPKVAIVAVACGALPGIARMHIFENDAGYSTLSEKWLDEVTEHRKTHVIKSEIDVPIETLDKLISLFGCPEYIKIDVEGYELDVVKGLSRVVRLISFECNLPTFKSETIEIIEYLVSKDPKAMFNFCDEEPPERFVKMKWLTGLEMIEMVNSDKYKFMEVFFRSSDVIA